MDVIIKISVLQILGTPHALYPTTLPDTYLVELDLLGNCSLPKWVGHFPHGLFLLLLSLSLHFLGPPIPAFPALYTPEFSRGFPSSYH